MMKPYCTTDGSLQSLQELIDQICDRDQPAGLIIFGGIENTIDECEADALFRMLSIPLSGGLFPALMFDGAVQETGWLVYAVHGAFSTLVVRDVSSDAAISELPSAVETSLVIIDGHARRISTFLKRLYAASHVATRFFGGGAGSLASSDRRCVISNEGLLRDTAVVVSTSSPSGIGVSHGWSPASRLMRVNAADGNTVLELDCQPAFNVYAELIADEFSATVDPNNLIGTASMFPLGVRRLGGPLIVRDPIAVSDSGGLVCVGEIQSECSVYVLTSDVQTLLQSSLEAAQQAERDLSASVEHRVVFDCISRWLLLQDDFRGELASLGHGDTPMSGVLSIGEVASSSDGFLEFYNKTTAVAAF